MDITYEQVLARLNTAKSKINNGGQTSADFAALGKEFGSISQAFQTLPGTYVVKAQIEACENYRKLCEENRILCQNEENEQNYRSALDRLSTAKQKTNNKKQSPEDFAELSKEFASIKQVFQLLPSSFDVKTQIEECESCLEQCEKQRQHKAKAELKKIETKEALKKVAWGKIICFVIDGVFCCLLGAFAWPVGGFIGASIVVVPCVIIGFIAGRINGGSAGYGAVSLAIVCATNMGFEGFIGGAVVGAIGGAIIGGLSSALSNKW